VSKDNLKLIVEAGHLAPSAMNSQEWYFYIVNNIEKNKEIGKKIHEVAAPKIGDMAKGAIDAGLTNCIFYDAPAVIYCCVNKDAQPLSYLSLGCAVQNMLLVAHKLGLAAVPVALAQIFGSDIVKAMVPIPETHSFFLAIPIGYRAKNSKEGPNSRKDDYFKYIE
jgi:nitroreductase